MMKSLTRLTSVILALTFALPIVGCEKKAPETEKQKILDVQVDAGKTKVKVEGTKKPDEKGKHIGVEVEHGSGHEQESGDRGK